MKMIKSISKRTLALILSMLMLLSSGIVGTLAANVDLEPVGANTTVSDGSYRLYFQFTNNTTWWNGSGCYHFAWVWGTNMTSQWRAIYKVGTTSNASDGSTSSVYYMDVPSGTLTGMKLIRAKSSTTVTNGSTTYGNPSYHNCTNDITLSNSISTYNLITGVTENSGSFTHNSRYTSVEASSYNATVTNAQSGSGTEADPYIVTPGQTMNVSATSSIDDHNFTIKYGYNSSSTYSASSTGTVTASSTADTSSSFRVYFTPLLNDNTSYKGTQTSVKLFYKTVDPKYTYAVTAGTGGTITSAISGSVTPGSGVTVTAKANTGYTFTGWTGTNGSFADASALSTTFTPTATGATAKANFAKNTYTVTFKDWDGSDLGTATVSHGSTATIPDDPQRPGYTFTGWSPTPGAITGDTTYTAQYTQDKYTVTVNTNCNGGKADANVTSDITYGKEVTLTADADDANGYKFTGWSITGDYTTNDALTSDEVTIIVNGDIVATANFALEEYEVGVTLNPTEGGTATATPNVAEHGSQVVLEAEAAYGYEFAGWSITGTYKTSDNLSSNRITITVTSDVQVTANFKKLDTYAITVNDYDKNKGTVTVLPENEVVQGSKIDLTAVPELGYKFTGWEIKSNENYKILNGSESSAAFSIIPQADVEITANFEAITGAVEVAAGEGGTVTNAGKHNVTYPEIVTATATPNESEGYQFTHWTVESAGKADKDYKVTENDNVIEVQILTDGTVVNVTANFANAQKIKVYTYSDSGFDRLTMTESDGTTTNTPVNNVTQSAVTFGEETWYTPGEVSLTPGFNTSITAQLFGDNPLAGGDGTLIMFNNTLGWSEVYMFASCSWHAIEDNGYGGAIPKDATDQYTMSNIKGTNYWYAYVSDLSKFDTILFVNTNVSGWGDMNSGQKASYRGDAIDNVTAGKIMFTPSTSVTEKGNGTPYYNSGTWSTKPTDVKSETGIANIVNELYDGNTWKGLDEIWIYIKSDGTYIATTKDRRELIDEVNSALMKRTYNNGVNDMEYTSSTWTAFVNAYKAAEAASGNPDLNNTELEAKHSALTTAYNNLKTETNIKITGSHGAEPHTNTSDYYGKTEFPGINTSPGSGNIGDNNTNEYYDYNTSYIYATITRGTTITINTNVEPDYEEDYLVYGWVVNGTEWVPATQDITDTSLYVGTYKCEKSAIFVPIYFRKTTIANWETDDSIIKIFANTEGASEKWGNYISAYTWMNPKNYYQFGHWTGQLMIPDTANPGMYYTFLETKSPDGTCNVSGIAFTNYGNNTPINTNARYQTYDYYEFIELAEQEYNNIVFKLKTFEGNDNSPKTSKETLSNYKFDYFRDFSGNMIDITRAELTDEQKAIDPALYIVRTGPVVYNNSTGKGWGSLEGSDSYVDAYLYKHDGTYIGRCKTYELTNLEKLKENRDIDLTTEEYAGKPVMVDYASLTTDSGGNKRFDGEWYGTVYGVTNVTIKTEVAFQNKDGSIQYYPGQNDVEDVGQAYINGEHIQVVSHGSEGHTINATALNGNDFVGWYRATVADDGTYTIDATATPLFTERSATIDASADAVYIAVFKEHPEGTFTVNNYYYTYDDFKGQPMSDYLPPVFGGDSSYSIRDVRINKIKDYQGNTIADGDKGFAGTYTQSYENISAGDVLEITIKTTPTYGRDYVYAWYIQANDAQGVNFEEIGTNELQDKYEPGAAKEFTFTYTVEEGVNSLSIYSDVVHVTPEVTLTYIYNNRYNETKTYIVKYTLTNDELTSYAPSEDTIRSNAPYVEDLYKNVEWVVDNVSSDATNWTLRAKETDVYTININVNGTSSEPIMGKFNESISIYANAIDDTVDGQKGLWYLEKGEEDNGEFDAGEDEILGYGTYYGYVITGDANVYFVSDYDYINQIILADAIYGYERATDANGNVNTNKVYVDYLISILLDVYTGEYIDLNGNERQDDNEPTIIDEENTNTPVSLKAIKAAGYEIEYGMVLELINTFTMDGMRDKHYGTDLDHEDELKALLATDETMSGDTGYEGETFFYRYDAESFGTFATNKNRVLMTFGYNNTEDNRAMFFNAYAYLKISGSDGNDTTYLISNQATLNIAEADKVTNS